MLYRCMAFVSVRDFHSQKPKKHLIISPALLIWAVSPFLFFPLHSFLIARTSFIPRFYMVSVPSQSQQMELLPPYNGRMTEKVKVIILIIISLLKYAYKICS